MDISPLLISIRVAFTATVVTFFLGVYLASLTVKMQKGKGLLDGILTLPLVLPPTVVGFFLLLLFGKNSLFGNFLSSVNIRIVFTWQGAVIAAAAVSFPLVYRTVRGALEQLDPDLVFAARTLGISEKRIFWRVVFPNILPSVIAGTVLGFTRAMGEFGATIMLAGNIPGRTQTISTAVYTAMQAGNRPLAYKWVAVVCSISLLTVVVMNYWNKAAATPRRRV
ncbi:MAG: molybdate ABC transporter permease subunit [Gracilibacteraceae bacterium]|nr:molybdate ABC transporter permease subunit [Gracilibacteraceae bacterium]